MLWLFLVNSTFAQKEIELIYKIESDSIFLRWAPKSIVAWKEGNKNGYILEIYKIDINKQKSTRQIVNQFHFKPKSLNEWERIKADTVAMVAANSIFYEYRDLNKIEQYNLEKMNYSMALFASDVSINAASYSGLYTSLLNTINEYSILLKLYIPNSSSPVDTTLLFLDSHIKNMTYPKLPSFQLKSDFNQIVIEGDLDGFEKYYSYYNIECSYDSIHFFKVNKNRYVVDNKNKQLVFKDSMRRDTMFYRICPIDYFFEPQQVSSVYKFIRDDIKELIIIKHRICDNHIVLELNYSLDGNDSLLVYYSTSPTATPKKVLFTSIENNVLLNHYSNGYYRVESRRKYSPYYYVEIEDSIAPDILNKSIDIRVDNYKAVLKWNRYEDVKYLNVYFRSPLSDYWILSNVTPIKDTFYIFNVPQNFIDTVTIGVSFLDIRYNESDLIVYNILLIDTIRPVSSVLDYYRIIRDTIELKWYYSSSHDYKSQCIVFISDLDTFRYSLNKFDTIYRCRFPCNENYTTCYIESIDNSENKSCSKGINLKCVFEYKDFLAPKLIRVQYTPEYNKLFWKDALNVKYIHIYKCSTTSKVFVKTVDSDVTSYLDYQISGDEKYFLVAESFSGVLSDRIYVQ
ncbi:MAG: hypothetical protein U0U66_01455 [Cytophagaceae bacterium]